jgi:hypothetical protein
MGRLYYGGTPDAIDIPDRVLAHLKVVATTKLRRGESFTVNWRHPRGETPGRSSIWLQPSVPLRFVFDSAEAETLDPEVLRDLADGANSSGGLTIDVDDLTLVEATAA